MKKILFALPLFLLALVPVLASAHERDTYTIGGANYQFVVGSIGEPLVVDDKSGLDLTVSKCYTAACEPTMGDDGDMDGPAGTPVNDLDGSLKVEMIAGNQKKTMDLSPQFGVDGAYKTTFYPTLATTFSYHITGMIENTPVDLTFTCVPEGATKAAANTNPVKLSDAVTQTSHSGSFGCPITKDDLGFPQNTTSFASVNDAIKNAESQSGNAKTLAEVALTVGAIGLAMGAFAVLRRRK